MLHDVQNEALAEQLRERKRLFSEQDRKLDFFLVSEPTWLEARYPEEAKRVRRPCVALVSTDKIWITCALSPRLPTFLCVWIAGTNSFDLAVGPACWCSYSRMHVRGATL